MSTKTVILEKRLEQVKEGIDLAEAIEKLHRNAGFKKVILNGYYEDEAIRLVALLSDPNMQQPEQQQLINSAMRGIGELRSWFTGMTQRAEQFKKMKHDIEAELVYLGENPEEAEEEVQE